MKIGIRKDENPFRTCLASMHQMPRTTYHWILTFHVPNENYDPEDEDDEKTYPVELTGVSYHKKHILEQREQLVTPEEGMADMKKTMLIVWEWYKKAYCKNSPRTPNMSALPTGYHDVETEDLSTFIQMFDPQRSSLLITEISILDSYEYLLYSTCKALSGLADYTSAGEKVFNNTQEVLSWLES